MFSEKAIQNFYDWEIRGRGYLLYPYPVFIEPPFSRFYHSYVDSSQYVDDGKVPRFFERLFSKKTPVVQEESEEEEGPEQYEYNPFLKQLNISFSKTPDIDDSLILEFLNMLSESNDQISFELIGKQDSVTIQMVCSDEDHRRVLHLLQSYFPESIVKVDNLQGLPFEEDGELLVVDFGYNDEFMRPINSSMSGLVGIMSVINHLRPDETVLLQVIFKGVENPWSDNIWRSVSVGKDCFFPDSPEMLICAKKKIASPLFSVVVRLAVQALSPNDSENLAYELIQNIKTASRNEFNLLIPLSNNGYDFESHVESLIIRGTNRLGMIMNTEELSSFVYFPETNRLISTDRKTKTVPNTLIHNDYFLGINYHLGVKRNVTLNDSQRIRHTHIIGATGVGKSTLITSLFLEDVKHGNGCVIFDPHGDTVDDIISRIPTNRLQDVILIDPSDFEYSFSINLLSAKTEVEKIVLSSDLVEAFRRHSTSWGDQMTSVLANAINTFLESSVGGTLLDLKRFLVDGSFRKEFLKSVNDENIHYYWKNEYDLLKRGSTIPLLTRLDTFLRPKLIRNILSQKEGLDFNEVLNGKKILLIKLSQGLIGEENSYLLGTLILSKIYQVAQARQSIASQDRNPFYVYLDEFQNFITPSINGILSGARKYGIGLVLAHQELNQIKDSDIYNSILSNANIRICFRLGDSDAKKMESGFSSFDSNDLQNLNIGEAIARVGRNTEDFSLSTIPLTAFNENENENRKIIIDNSRKKYSIKISEFQEVSKNQSTDIEKPKSPMPEVVSIEEPKEEITESVDIKQKSKEYIETFTEKEEVREHRYLQTFIKKIAEQRGFKASIEEIVENGRVDVSLVKDSIKIACEIAVSNSVEYEVKNIDKCLNAGYSNVCILSKNEVHLENIKKRTKEEIKDLSKIHFFNPNQMTDFLDLLLVSVENGDTKEERIKGYRVKVNYRAVDKP